MDQLATCKPANYTSNVCEHFLFRTSATWKPVLFSLPDFDLYMQLHRYDFIQCVISGSLVSIRLRENNETSINVSSRWNCLWKCSMHSRLFDQFIRKWEVNEIFGSFFRILTNFDVRIISIVELYVSIALTASQSVQLWFIEQDFWFALLCSLWTRKQYWYIHEIKRHLQTFVYLLFASFYPNE